jgi:TM2 domain-containing membrane protein YozV
MVIQMVICPNCGKNTPEGKFCESCGAALQAPPVAPVAQQVPPAAPAGVKKEKNVALAAIASFLCSGLGQVYNGQLGKGLAIYLGALIGYFIFVIPGVLVWIYGIYDAYTTAKKMNEGTLPFTEYNTMHIIGFIVLVIIIAVIMI